MLDFKKIENICAIVLLVAFFLPWLSIGGLISFSGYQLPNAAQGLNALASAFSESEPETNYAAYLVYLVPLVAIAVLAADYLKSDEKTTRIISIVAGVIPVGGFIYAVTQVEFSALAIGAFLTFLSGVGILLATFGVVKIPK